MPFSTAIAAKVSSKKTLVVLCSVYDVKQCVGSTLNISATAVGKNIYKKYLVIHEIVNF